MRKLIASAVTVLTVGAAVAAGTQAVFSDTDSFEGNVLGTATVSIQAKSEPKGLLPKPLSVQGLIPGQWSDYARGVVSNQADSTDVEVYMYVDNVAGDACNKVNLQVWTGNAANGADSERGYVLHDGKLNALKGAGNRVEVTGKVFDVLQPNWSAVIQQRAGLDESAGNSYQGTDCTWDEVFVAETPVVVN